MKNKMKNFGIFSFVFCELILISFAVNSYGSGTYSPPLAPSWDISELNDEEIKQGQELFEGRELVGSGGKTCYECHGEGQAVPLKRSSLKKKATQMSAVINNCLTDSTRSAGKSLEPGSKKMIQMGAYLVSQYRLPHATMKYIKNK